MDNDEQTTVHDRLLFYLIDHHIIVIVFLPLCQLGQIELSLLNKKPDPQVSTLKCHVIYKFVRMKDKHSSSDEKHHFILYNRRVSQGVIVVVVGDGGCVETPKDLIETEPT